MGAPLWVLDVAASRVVWANAAGLELWNARSLVDLASRDLAETWPAAVAGSRSELEEMAAGKVVQEPWTLHPRGQATTFMVTRVAIRCEDGTLATLHEAQPVMPLPGARPGGAPALRAAEHVAELEDLYENAPCGYHSLGPDGAILRVNATELAWLGYSSEELLGRHFRDLLAPESQHAFDHNLDRALPRTHDPGYGEVEYEVVRKDGTTCRLAIVITIVRDSSGNFVRSRSAAVDVTERRRAEREVREQAAGLRSFLDHSGDLIHAADLEGRLTYVNAAWCEALGYTEAEARALTLFDVVGADDHAAMRASMATLLVDAAPRRVERLLVTRAGAFLETEGAASARRQGGRPVGFIASLHDVTARRRAEETLRHSHDQLVTANAELERASRAKDEFLAAVSHELRTPLNGVLGLSEALDEGVYGPLAGPQQRALGRIQEAGKHLLDLINELLDLSRIEAGKATVSLAPVRLADVCGWSVRQVQHAAQAKHQTLSVVVDAGRPLRADGRRLGQLLVNLLGNAVKFTPEGGALGLEVVADEAEDVVRLVVWDTGIGIPPDQVERIFQPFVQLDASLARQYAGTGLGLALVRRIVELHGGRVAVESAPGAGSRFTVTLPWIREGEAEGERPPPTWRRPPTPERASGQARPRVLVVEDDDLNLATLRDYLEARGYDTTAARTGREAVAEAARAPPDLVLMDIQLPEMDGLTAIRALRVAAPPGAPALPIVALTALAMPGDRERCLAAGADDYVTKPVCLRDLIAVIEALRARHDAVRGRG
jgi:PAS domain S-box-containing protein